MKTAIALRLPSLLIIIKTIIIILIITMITTTIAINTTIVILLEYNLWWPNAYKELLHRRQAEYFYAATWIL